MPAVSESKYLISCGWNDVAHLSEKTKRELLASTPAHLRTARSRGIPVLGSGLVYGVDEAVWVCEPFQVPAHWVRLGGMDFGWNHPWALVECAWDRDTDTFYVIRDAKRSEYTPRLAWTDYSESWPLQWLPIAWPHDGLQHDKGSGEQLAAQYAAAGFKMMSERATFPDGTNGLEAGVLEILGRKQAGTFKVFKSCGDYIAEARLYHRKDGLIVKLRDDILSAARYAWMMRRYAVLPPSSNRTKLRIHKGWKAA